MPELAVDVAGDLAVVEEDDAVGDAGGVGVVRDHQRGLPVAVHRGAKQLEDPPGRLRVEISRSPIQTCPSVGLSRPARMCMRVDLPEPDAPMTAVNCPAGTSRVTPRSAWTADSPSP